jgi:regulator of cell morphogenesis and NO signaling
MTTFIDHILSRYHAKLREDLPRLTAMGGKVVNAHGDHHPEVRNVASTFAGLRAELDTHMMKEEQILFPFIQQLEAGTAGSHPMLGHLAGPIAVMEREHDNAGMALATLRDVTEGYNVPGDGCTTFQAYYNGLAALERDLHAHIHLENNILFPRGVQIEARVMAAW